MTRKLLSAGIGQLLGCSLLFAVFFFREDQAGVTKANLSRIELEKTDKAAVEIIFGRKWSVSSGCIDRRTPPEQIDYVWFGSDGMAVLAFDENQIVISKAWQGKSAWDRMREFSRIKINGGL